MWRLIKRVIVYILLLVYGLSRRDRFVKTLTRRCKKRQKRMHVDGITEELDEVDDLPEDILGDIHFVGFTKTGEVVSFRTVTEGNRREHVNVSLELPARGRFTYNDCRPLNCGSGKLRLQMLEPMRRWKIAFHGGMESHVGAEITERLHVSVSFYWQCLADPFDHCTSLSRWQLAKTLSDHALDSGSWLNILDKECIWYEQWGEMWGRIEIEGHAVQHVRMQGFRSRQIVNQSESSYVSHHVIQDGGGYFITNGCVPTHAFDIKQNYGYLTVPSGEQWVTDQSSIRLQKDSRSLTGCSIQYPMNISSYEIPLSMDTDIVRANQSCIKTGPVTSCVNYALFTINGKRAYGVQYQSTISLGNYLDREEPSPKENKNKTTCTNKITMHFQHRHCNSATIAGGKGANLASLYQLDYSVPKGFCVTTFAFKLQLEASANLQTSIDSIAETIRNKAFLDLPSVCTDAELKWQNTEMCPSVDVAIENELVRTFGQNYQDMHFAVRSSGVREDGTELSFAGQMETCLGVQGLENILEAVRKCWASSFSFQAVEYRRQNGQLPTESMAVVIQEMVDADSAGVLFTNDPVTGYSSVMVVNAAPGLGDKVVSGTVSPDTIRISRNKEHEELKIIKKYVGEIPSNLECQESPPMCINDVQILNLCQVGLQIEEAFGYPQDIEWAIERGQLYILQARPITSLARETDQEMLHEFDTPMSMDRECVTISNIGESMPGAVSTLTRDIGEWANAICQRVTFDKYVGSHSSSYATKSIMHFTNKKFINMTNMSLVSDAILQDKDSVDISATGSALDELTWDMIYMYKGKRLSFLTKLWNFMTVTFIHRPKEIKWFEAWVKQLDGFAIGTDATTAKELYTSLDGNLYLYSKLSETYVYKTMQSQTPFGVLLKLLRGNNRIVSRANSKDIAVLLARCSNVVSAEVPRSLQDLADAIKNSPVGATFLTLPVEKCHDHLMNADNTVRKKYQHFMENHGHRCIRELEFMEKSWKADPANLVRALKLLVANPSPKVQRTEGAGELDINSLKTPLSWYKKYFIKKYLLDKARAGVAARERGKSALVKTKSAFKDAYWRLADMMVRECRLPEDKLLFFLTHDEIGTLIETHSASLVGKAKQRMQLLQVQNSISYPKISFGIPEPMPEEYVSMPNWSSAVACEGMPVGKGIAIGSARVVVSLDDADKIQQGDILICPFTDIGWSPYFPLISGLVTELGGLISHGAVIARETGIPCVVNVTNATKIFQTGDTVRIDGLEGIISKLQ